MNQRQIAIKRTEVYKKYHIPNCQNFIRRTRNAVILHIQNNKPHELKKAEVCYDLLKEGKEFVTEVQRNKANAENLKPIVDIVVLDDDNMEIEIVDSSGDLERYKKEGITTIFVDDNEKIIKEKLGI